MTEDAPHRGLGSAGKRGSEVTEDGTVLGSDGRHKTKRSRRPRAGYCAQDDVSLQFGRADRAGRDSEEGAGRQLAPGGLR